MDLDGSPSFAGVFGESAVGRAEDSFVLGSAFLFLRVLEDEEDAEELPSMAAAWTQDGCVR